jgi:hypothetical protein
VACLPAARAQLGSIITIEALRQYLADHPDCERAPSVHSTPLVANTGPVQIRNENGHYYPRVTIRSISLRCIVGSTVCRVALISRWRRIMKKLSMLGIIGGAALLTAAPL